MVAAAMRPAAEGDDAEEVKVDARDGDPLAGGDEAGEHDHRREGRGAGEERAGERFADGLVHHLAHAATAATLNGLTNAVEDDDGVVDGITGEIGRAHV